MDEKDLEQASKLEEADRQIGIERARRSIYRPANFNGFCMDCNDTIPSARLNTGAARCMECQERFELKQKIGHVDVYDDCVDS
jgi:RNA polymerase-binding transcription factor DksA